MLKVTKVALSQNPNALISTDGKFNITKDGRLYLMVHFEDADNPFGGTRQRMIAQQFDANQKPIWKVNLDSVFASVGKTVAGDIITLEVEPYEVSGRQVTTYSAVVFKNENAETVFLNSGRRPLGSTRELPPRFRTATMPAGAGIVTEHVAEVHSLGEKVSG